MKNRYRTEQEIEQEIDNNIIQYHKFVHINDVSNEFLSSLCDSTKEQLIKKFNTDNFSIVVYEEHVNSEKYKSDFTVTTIEVSKIRESVRYINALDFFKKATYENVLIFVNDIKDIEKQINEFNKNI